ncbi:type 4b pilus protein PilO2 [Leptospirillum ferriphilum]|uniref:Uncharacterized protein n=2 Tax=Leptospirillum ferriphilum TaxID=178606 RepID=A0A1V3SWT8_9BACT|nr:type 4b pilus protein PilO2 [Leptospirillum ferriphilum]OOH72814.1 hypothetical protein BOX24_05340 [Leptospirillum ferriphilum]
MARVVTIGKKKYAAGLSWGPLDPEKPLRPQALEKSRQSQNGLYVIYGEVEPHVGHCDAANGVKAGMPVLAPLVAEIWPANTLLAETLDASLAVGFQIMNGLIYDDVVGAPDEIRSWFDGLAGEHKWDHISSPWGPEAVRPGAFEDSLRDPGTKAPRLRSIHEGRGLMIKTGVGIIAGLVLFLALSKIVQHRKEMAARLAMLSRHVVRTVIPPVRIVPVGPFVKACKDALDRIPAFPSGWKARTVSCRPGRIRITWGREESAGEGTIRDLEGALGRSVRFSGVGRVRSDFPLSVSGYPVPVDRLPDLTEEKKDFVSVLERFGLRYGMDSGSVLPGTSSNPSSGSAFSVDLPFLPDDTLLSGLSAVAGLSVRALEWTGQPRWILKGELKHAPIDFNHHRTGSSGTDPVGGGGPGGKSGPGSLVPNGQPGSFSGSVSGGSGSEISRGAFSGIPRQKAEQSLPTVRVSPVPGRRAGDP